MKKQYFAAFACILAAACSKAELNEVEPGPSGESLTLTLPQTLPQTKVAVSGDSYQFELDDEITAIASNGSRATLKPNAASSGAQTATNYFTGTFDKPVADGSTISFYYNAKSIADNGTATFEQNGDPWLVSTGNNFTRTEDRQISVTATLAAPENVRAIAVIFTDSEGIDSFEFHAKDQSIELGTFDGTSFSGNSTVSQNVLNHQSEGIEFMRSNIVYVPKDMEGGFWIKAVKGQQAMYKSYATKNPIENTTVAISSFVPAKVDIDVKISGFATSYSYAKGIDGVAQSIATANSKSNDWMDEGKAVCTITKSGIPSTLLSVKSVSMLVNGEEYSKDYTDDGNNTFTLHKTAHTKWEQKNVSVRVVYSTPDGLEFEGTSNTLTRHITGLPYAANPPKSSEWENSGHNVYFEDSYVQMGKKGIDVGLEKYITKNFDNIPSQIDVLLLSTGMIHGERFAASNLTTDYVLSLNNNEIKRQSGTTSDSNFNISVNATFLPNSKNTIKCESTYPTSRPYVRISSIKILYM